MTTFSEYISSQYEVRRSRNPNYSFRAFCRDLNISPGRMVNFVKRGELPSDETVIKICLALRLSQKEVEEVEAILEEERYLSRGNKFTKRLTPKEFKLISDWKTWSILTAFQCADFVPDVSFFINKFSLSKKEVLYSLDKLEKVKLIQKSRHFFELLFKNITTTTDIPS